MKRTWILIATTALVAVVAASTAATASAAIKECGAVTAAGKRWQVAAHGVTCGAAKTLVRRLAPKTRPLTAPAYPGTFLGMHCSQLGGGGRKREIACTGPGREVFGVTK
jgi:hypothetical protein